MFSIGEKYKGPGILELHNFITYKEFSRHLSVCFRVTILLKCNTQTDCGYLHKMKPAKIPAEMGRSSPGLPFSEELLSGGNFRGGRAIFLGECGTGRFAVLQRMAHGNAHACTGGTSWN